MAIYNIERCSDGCRTSLLIARVVLVPPIFHTLIPPCYPYITIHFMEMIFPLVPLIFWYMCAAYIKKAISILSCIQIPTPFSWYKPAFYWNLPVMTFHCVHTYLIICFLQNNHNCDDQKTVVIMVILFECVVCYYVACSPWDHHSDSSVWSVKVKV